jgi:hypothetical protein
MSLEKLSPELRTYVNNIIKEAIATNKPLLFRRVGSDIKYMRCNPPRDRVMSKIYSPYFAIFDNFDEINSNKTLVYTQGVETRIIGGNPTEIAKKGKMIADERGYIRPNMSDTLLIACLLLSNKNQSYKFRDKSVTADWFQVKEGVKGYAGNTDLLKMKTEHQLSGIILQMPLMELQAYATELQSSANVAVGINRPPDELRTSLITTIKKDPIYFGRFIPSPESNVKVLAAQAINSDLITYDQVKREWNFVHKWNKEPEGFAGGSMNVSNAEDRLVEFLLKQEGKRIKKKIEKILFPTDEDGWEFLSDPKAVLDAEPAPAAKVTEEIEPSLMQNFLDQMKAMREELAFLKQKPETVTPVAPVKADPVVSAISAAPETASIATQEELNSSMQEPKKPVVPAQGNQQAASKPNSPNPVTTPVSK